jgi:hypothetical protein
VVLVRSPVLLCRSAHYDWLDGEGTVKCGGDQKMPVESVWFSRREAK